MAADIPVMNFIDPTPLETFIDLLPETASELRAYLASLDKLRESIRAFYAAFPLEELTESDRRTMSSTLFDDAREFVTLLAGVLQKRKNLFAHIPVDPEVLELRQQVANTLWALSCHFERLHRLCADAFLTVQSGTIEESRQVITRVHQEGELLFHEDPDLNDRQLALRAPEKLLPNRGRPPKRKGGRRRRRG